MNRVTGKQKSRAALSAATASAVMTKKAFAGKTEKKRIGVLGLGSHNFSARFANPPDGYDHQILAESYGVWDDVPEAAKIFKEQKHFRKVYNDPVKLAEDCDCIHIEHADYRKVLELARPGLTMGKATFINRPFTASIEDAEEIVRLAERYKAPLMSASSLEFGDEVNDMQQFMVEKGPIRAYEAYGPEAHFTWHFPHVFNYAHAALGGGVDTVYFTGHFGIDMRKWRVENEPAGASLAVLTYKSRNSEPPIIGMCHIGNYRGQFHIDVYGAKENRDFTLSGNWGNNMFHKINMLYSYGEIPRPYEAILEQHRMLTAANMSRIRGRAVALSELGGKDSIPYSDAIRTYVLSRFLDTQ